jgi:hypothetical protein
MDFIHNNNLITNQHFPKVTKKSQLKSIHNS